MHMLHDLQIPACSEDYRLWLQTMYVQFGQKWAKLHHGPMWSIVRLSQGDGNDTNSLGKFDTMKVYILICPYIIRIVFELSVGKGEEYSLIVRTNHS